MLIFEPPFLSHIVDIDPSQQFEFENGFYLTSTVGRMSKFATHLDLFRRTSTLPGNIVECGVFKGASISRFIKFRSLFENANSRKIIGFDTFGKFPDAQFEADKEVLKSFVREAGAQSISKPQLIALLKRNSLYQNVELIEGNLLETAPEYIKENARLKISLLHIDVDLYEATKVALEFFYPCVVRGGIVILDDYGAFPGANKAIDDFFQNQEINIQKLSYSHAISFVEKP
jgi:hypothetical protein